MNIIKISQSLYKKLENKTHVCTQVHSVFNSACNLSSEFGLISVVSATKRMNPRALMIRDANWFKHLRPNQNIKLIVNQSSSFSAPDQLEIHPQSVIQFSPYLGKDITLTPEIRTIIYNYLETHQKEMGIYPLLCLSGKFALSSKVTYYSPMLSDYFVPKLIEFIETLETQSLSIDLTKFVGFGSGLTPSSDDLLVGLLSALDILNHPYFATLSSACLNSADKTTDVSRFMLQSACEHQYNQEIVELYSAINNNNDLGEKISHLLEIGHSSGHDTLCGIYIGLELFS